MMEGHEIVRAWKEWLNSEEGRKASNPYTLGDSSHSHRYLENRLHGAFEAGIRAAEDRQGISAATNSGDA